MTAGTYIITHIKSNKYYIGGSLNIEKRIKTHKRLLIKNNHHNKFLQKLFNESNNINDFKFKIINICQSNDRNNIQNLEQILLNKYYNDDLCLNIHKYAKGGGADGELNAMWGKTHTAEVKKKLSEINQGRDDQHMAMMRSKITKRFDGHKHTEETKQKIRNIHLGSKRSEQTKQKMIKSSPNRKKVVAYGKIYDSLNQCGKALGLTRSQVTYRADKSDFKDIYYYEGVETIER